MSLTILLGRILTITTGADVSTFSWVVLESGWAAHTFVKFIESSDHCMVVVSPVNHFVFTPILASVAVGTVEYCSMTVPIRNDYLPLRTLNGINNKCNSSGI